MRTLRRVWSEREYGGGTAQQRRMEGASTKLHERRGGEEGLSRYAENVLSPKTTCEVAEEGSISSESSSPRALSSRLSSESREGDGRSYGRWMVARQGSKEECSQETIEVFKPTGVSDSLPRLGKSNDMTVRMVGKTCIG